MSTTSTRRSARLLAVLAAVPVSLVVSALPASAVPDEGSPVAPADNGPIVLWGWTNGEGPAYPGQRFGIVVPAQPTGHLLEFMDH